MYKTSRQRQEKSQRTHHPRSEEDIKPYVETKPIVAVVSPGSMALEEALVTAVMAIIKEMMNMSKDMLSILKTTIEVLNHHQEQLTFLQLQDSRTVKKKETKVKGKGKGHLYQGCIYCGRLHFEEHCPLIHQTCFCCHHYGHYVATCPRNIQGTKSQAEPSSRRSGSKRTHIYDEENGRNPKNFCHHWDRTDKSLGKM